MMYNIIKAGGGIVLEGQQFNEWTVIERSKNKPFFFYSLYELMLCLTSG